MNLEEDLLKYIERFKNGKKVINQSNIYDDYLKLFIICNVLIKNKNKKLSIKDIKKIIEKEKLTNPFFIDKIINYYNNNNIKNENKETLKKFIVDTFFISDYLKIYEHKLEEIKTKSKKIEINIIEKKISSNNLNYNNYINENLYKLFNESEYDFVESYINMINLHSFKLNETDFEILVKNKILIPLTMEFNRFHKSTYKTKISKNETRSNLIVNKINDIKKDFSQKNNFININNNYSILYNRIEEINIINRFITEDGYFIKNIDNRESYIKLKEYFDKKYFNFSNNMFMLETDSKIISIRKNMDNSYVNKIEFRNIPKRTNIDIHGFILTNDIKNVINHKKIKNIKEIKDFNKNLKFLFDKDNLNYIYFNNENSNLLQFFEVILKFMKKYVIKNNLIHKYINLFNEKEKCFIHINRKYRKKKIINKKGINLKNVKVREEKKKIIYSNRILYNKIILYRKKYSVEKINNNNNKYIEQICIHLIELKENKDHNYIVNKYGILKNNFFICKFCNAIIMNNIDISSNTLIEEYNNSKNSNDNFIYNDLQTKYENFKEDLLLIELYIKKIFKILNISYLIENNIGFFLNNLMTLIINHENIDKNFTIKNELFIEKEDGKKMVFFIYIQILIVILLSKSDTIKFYKIDNICNVNVYMKNRIFFENLYIRKKSLKSYETLSYYLFISSCIITKYILKITDKKLFNKNMKLIIYISIKIINHILESDNKIYNFYRNIFNYKLNTLYNLNINLKNTTSKRIINKNVSKYKHLLINKNTIYKNLFYKRKYINRKNNNKNIFDLKKYNIIIDKNISKLQKKKIKKKEINFKRNKRNNFLKNTLSLDEFVKKNKINDNNQYYIDFDLNGYKTDKEVFIDFSKIIVTKKKNVIMIYNTFLKCYMYFHSYYLYYLGYSLSKNIENIILYKNQNVYLKIKLSLKNKFKYIGYTNLFYHINIDQNIYIIVNKNINIFLENLHFYLNSLKNNIVIKNPKNNLEKNINNVIQNYSKNKIYYENEFYLKFDIYKYKLKNKLFKHKNIIFIKDIYENNIYSTIYLQYIYYNLDVIINKNKFLRNFIFTFLNEQFDIFFTNHYYVEYKNKYKIYYDCNESSLISENILDTTNENIIEKKNKNILENENDNENTFDYDELDIEENPFDSED